MSTRLVTAPDADTLQIKITEDFSPSLVLSLMSSVVGSVVDMKTVMEHEADGDMGYAWLKTNSAGSGAYRSKPGRPMKVSRSKPMPRPIAAVLPAMKRVVIMHVPEPAAQRLLISRRATLTLPVILHRRPGCRHCRQQGHRDQ